MILLERAAGWMRVRTAPSSSAVSPDMVYADDHGKHGKQNGADGGGLRKGAVLMFCMGQRDYVYFSVFSSLGSVRRCTVGME